MNNLESTLGKEDSSETFFNKEYNESYHSYVGPIVEAKHKFVEPSDLSELFSRENSIKILDPFFGLGYNTGIMIQKALTLDENKNIEVIAIEKDNIIVEKIKDLTVPEEYSPIKKELGKLYLKKEITIKNIKISLTIKDINNVIDDLNKNSFDLIYFDPFSYKATPRFWEEDFLLKMFQLLKSKGRLCTYSSMKKVENLAIANGLEVKKISPLGRRKYSLCLIKP